MSDPGDCSQNRDPLKLVREGTAQIARPSKALDPAYVPANEHGVAHNLVFAQSYAALLKYFDSNDTAAGDWRPLFSGDLSALLAVPAIEDIDAYTSNTQSWFDYLNDLENQSKTSELKDRFGYLYSSVASLARRLDDVKQALPGDAPLRGTLQNLIRTQLAPAFKRLIAYYKGGAALGLVNAVAPAVRILGAPAATFDSVLNPSAGSALSTDWSNDQAWAAYAGAIGQDASVYGPVASVFTRINHCSTHTLFKAAVDQFLRVYSRVVGEAKQAFDDSLTKNDTHEPQYALFLAFLRLLEYARQSGNALTRRHLDFYYRAILGLNEKRAEPGHVHLLAELAKQASSREFKPGELFKAGKDEAGKDAFFANSSDVVANRATVTARKTLYRHGGECVGGTMLHQGRLYASPAADSADGLGAPLTSVDGSWHPFFNKVYTDGALTEIRMPKAQIGFAVASHYLLMAGGTRWITATLKVSGYSGPVSDDFWTNLAQVDFAADFTCLVTTEKGWLEKPPYLFFAQANDTLLLAVLVAGGDPPIVPYSQKIHGYSFQTDQPIVLVTLRQDDTRSYAYSSFRDVVVSEVVLGVNVGNLKSVAVSNDFGPLDTSKPFQPFGTSPIEGSSLIIGSKEIFQKQLAFLYIQMDWLIAPTVYPLKTGTLPDVAVDFLSGGQWAPTSNAAVPVSTTTYYVGSNLDKPVLDQPDFTPNAFYSTQSRYGFAKLRLTRNVGQDAYQADLITFLRKDANAVDPGSKPPTGPTASALSISYAASHSLLLNTASQQSYEKRPGQFFHLTPFGTAEQHPYVNGKGQVFLLSQASEAEFYIGVSGLVPPQNLSLLFQVVDGTANPLAEKPVPHIKWAYLRQNEWIEFDKTEVQDATDELLNSGIVILSVPRDATNSNTALPEGLFWIRAAVYDTSDAVCRLQLVAAQAMEAVFADRGNAAGFSATALPAGTITKLAQPDAAVKGIVQPFPSFGGRGAEQSQAFFTRISERLRHKNRGLVLWDYERLILEAFPEVYKVKCLNHTCFEPGEGTVEGCDGTTDACRGGIYRELAPGHVTIVAIPSLQQQNLRDPLKPFTSLRVLEAIKAFLEARTSCFAELHVKNPQFEEVRVRFSLRLHDGFDETFYPNELKQAITRFLSPWAFAGGGLPSFGGTIYKSVLINFVEEQPYVDYVTDFQLFVDICGKPGTADLDHIEGSRAVSILVSAPATRHEIALIKPAQDAPLGETCRCDS
jgi:hypothetical protein